MGLFTFIKEAGEKLFGGKDANAASAAHAAVFLMVELLSSGVLIGSRNVPKPLRAINPTAVGFRQGRGGYA